MAAVVASDTQLMLGVGLIGEHAGSLPARSAPAPPGSSGPRVRSAREGLDLGCEFGLLSAGTDFGPAGGRDSRLRLTRLEKLVPGCASLRLPASMGDAPGAIGRTRPEVAEQMLEPGQGDSESLLPEWRPSCHLIQVFLEFLHGHMWNPC